MDFKKLTLTLKSGKKIHYDFTNQKTSTSVDVEWW